MIPSPYRRALHHQYKPCLFINRTQWIRFKSNFASGPPKSNSRDFLYGANVVLPALESSRRTPYKLFVKPNTKSSSQSQDVQEDDSGSNLVSKAIQLARKKSIPVETVSVSRLDNLSDNRPHQGMVLSASPIKMERLVSLPESQTSKSPDALESYTEATGRSHPVWIALDQILDPQNLGAILRTCHFFGVDGVILTERATSPLTPLVSKVSSGAMEVMRIATTPNLSTFLRESMETGWVIYGTDIHAPQDQIIDLGYLKNVERNPDEEKHPLLVGPTVLVFGNEGHGLRAQVAKQCHQHLLIPKSTIPGAHDVSHPVDSMNVSVSVGIILYALLYG